jgi:glycosyltransferase involved in cell wall biosynthesis
LTPLISIITINYNNAAGLERTIQSIVSQTYMDFEYLIIDGNSADGSKEIIRKYADKITYHISEPDSGIYNAMNKGIAQAKGKYLLFINSGDELTGVESLHSVYKHLNDEDLVYFDLLLQLSAKETQVKMYPDKLWFSYFMFDSLPHPASFIKRELFTRLGPYNENLKIVSDWGFFLTAICKHNISYKHIAAVFSLFHLDGISSTTTNNFLIASEKRQVLQTEFPMFANLYDELWEARLLKENSIAIRPPILKRVLRKLGF